MAWTGSGPDLHFIDEAFEDGGEQKEKRAAKRRKVRSQAMVAVRRKQRLDAEVYLNLRWNVPKVATRLEASHNSSEGKSMKNSKAPPEIVKYDFVEVPTRGASQEQPASRRKSRPAFKHERLTDCEHDQSTLVFVPALEENRPAISSIERFGGGRRSPFDSYPTPFNDEINELMDHYTIVIPYLMYGTKVHAPMQRLLYHLSFDNIAALCGIMTLASKHIDSLHGLKESARSLRHMSAAVKAVKSFVDSGVASCDDGTIFAVALLATIERRLGDAAVSKTHWLGMKRILAQRGGLESISSNRRLGAMLVWNDLVFAKDQHDKGPQKYEWPSLTVQDVEEQNQTEKEPQLFDFLDQLEKTSYIISRREHGRGLPLLVWKQRRKIFWRGSTMHNTLIAEPEIKGRQRDLTALACQYSCLIYLGVALLDQVNQLDVEGLFLTALEPLTEDELSRGLSPEHLLARLLMGLTDEAVDELDRRAHTVMRLMLELKELDSYKAGMVRERLWRCVAVE